MITDGSAARDATAWLARLERWIGEVDFVQIREPELSARELVRLVKTVCSRRARARVLVNDRADIAVACGADGVHLRDGSIGATALRTGLRINFTVSVACHTLEGVRAAAAEGADYILLAPVFAPLSKKAAGAPLGVDVLREAARSVSVPLIALGGITDANARACVEAGAAGIAGISAFSR